MSAVFTCGEMRNVQGSMTRSLERWHRNRMSELDMMQPPHTDALRPKLAHSVSHVFRETCFVSTCATSSALSTLRNRKRPIETHDCIANSLISTCFKRPRSLTMCQLQSRRTVSPALSREPVPPEMHVLPTLPLQRFPWRTAQTHNCSAHTMPESATNLPLNIPPTAPLPLSQICVPQGQPSQRLPRPREPDVPSGRVPASCLVWSTEIE